MAEKIQGVRRVALGGDKNYDTQDFVRELRGMNITPHVAQNNKNRASAIDDRTTGHAGYEVVCASGSASRSPLGGCLLLCFLSVLSIKRGNWFYWADRAETAERAESKESPLFIRI
jgi:hypothetical protein